MTTCPVIEHDGLRNERPPVAFHLGLEAADPAPEIDAVGVELDGRPERRVAAACVLELIGLDVAIEVPERVAKGAPGQAAAAASRDRRPAARSRAPTATRAAAARSAPQGQAARRDAASFESADEGFGASGFAARRLRRLLLHLLPRVAARERQRIRRCRRALARPGHPMLVRERRALGRHRRRFVHARLRRTRTGFRPAELAAVGRRPRCPRASRRSRGRPGTGPEKREHVRADRHRAASRQERALPTRVTSGRSSSKSRYIRRLA